MEELVNNVITSELAKLNPDTDQELLKSMHKILARNVDPKLVLGIKYEVVKAKINGIKKVDHDINKIRIGPDETLQQMKYGEIT